jgi:hypothetical protein
LPYDVVLEDSSELESGKMDLSVFVMDLPKKVLEHLKL